MSCTQKKLETHQTNGRLKENNVYFFKGKHYKLTKITAEIATLEEFHLSDDKQAPTAKKQTRVPSNLFLDTYHTPNPENPEHHPERRASVKTITSEDDHNGQDKTGLSVVKAVGGNIAGIMKNLAHKAQDHEKKRLEESRLAVRDYIVSYAECC